MKKRKRRLPFANICVSSGDILTLENTKNIQMNKITGDIIHSTQFHIKYINRAILAYLQHRPMKFGRLVALQASHLTHKNSLTWAILVSIRNKTQTAVTNISLNCITFINLTSRMLQHTWSEVIIVQLQINLNSKIQLCGLGPNEIDWHKTITTC